MIFQSNIIKNCIRMISVKRFSLKVFLLLTFFGSASFFILAHYLINVTPEPVKTYFPMDIVQCPDDKLSGHFHVNDHINEDYKNLTGVKVLIVAELPYSSLLKELVNILESLRFKYKVVHLGRPLPQLTNKNIGLFSTIVFEKLESYLTLDTWNQELINDYCVKHKVGIVAFAQTTQVLNDAQVKSLPLYINTNIAISKYTINSESPVLRITKSGSLTFNRDAYTSRWSVFYSNHSTYEPISTITPVDDLLKTNCMFESCQFAPIIRDKGLMDGVQKIFFGLGFRFWLHRPLFVDALSFISHGKLSTPLERNVLIDIDDIFVGKPYTRMTKSDVLAMLDSQKRIKSIVKDFRFNLGFSGKYYKHGTHDENEGDEILLENKNEFWWFGHTWSHSKAHLFNLTGLIEDMESNRAFAKMYNIPVNTSYAVAPYHSGVYPVHEELYDAWKLVWNIKVTSTEEYPNLRPPSHRRGFVHKDIQVLPRQTCGLFSHTIFLNKFPGGKTKLNDIIRGGELFQTILFNPVIIIMTHLPNYGNDRLALYTFENAFQFVKCWTNLNLRTIEPTAMADYYFNSFPDEVNPIWKNPCRNKRHKAIWSPTKQCDRLPSMIILGPQKTGSTALSTYLSLHPSLISNLHNPVTFEEVQFFVGDNYKKGVDWYMNQFPLLENLTEVVLFEKSANYFTESLAPFKVISLVPKVKLICIIIDPSIRAYSWYQHVLSHDNPVAKQHSFREVITANQSSSVELLELARKCLMPGLYVYHMDKWFRHFPKEQILILNGENLRSSPISVMDDVQNFLEVKTYLNYSSVIKYSSKKGFYCPYSGSKMKCLGSGKGRKYPPMDTFSKLFLTNYYHQPNIDLYKLLKRHDYPIPDWLVRELNNKVR